MGGSTFNCKLCISRVFRLECSIRIGPCRLLQAVTKLTWGHRCRQDNALGCPIRPEKGQGSEGHHQHEWSSLWSDLPPGVGLCTAGRLLCGNPHSHGNAQLSCSSVHAHERAQAPARGESQGGAGHPGDPACLPYQGRRSGSTLCSSSPL